MNMKKILVVAIRTIFILAIFIWESGGFSLKTDSQEAASGKQLILLFVGAAIAIVSIVTFRGKEK